MQADRTPFLFVKFCNLEFRGNLGLAPDYAASGVELLECSEAVFDFVSALVLSCAGVEAAWLSWLASSGSDV